MSTSAQTTSSGSLEPNIPKRKNFFEAFYNLAATTITPFFLRRPWTPNQITIVSGVFGIIAAGLLISQKHLILVIAAFCIQVFAILDLVDGNIARAKNMQSKFGQWLDIFFDKLNDLLLIVGLTIGAYRSTGHLYVAFSGITLMGLVFFIQFIMILNDTKLKTEKTVRDKNGERNDTNSNNSGFARSVKRVISPIISHSLLGHSLFLILISIFACFNILYFGLCFLAIYAFVTWLIIVTHTFCRLWRYEKTL